VLFEIADPALRSLVREFWSGFLVPSHEVRAPDAVFRFHDRTPALPSLKRSQLFVNARTLVMADRRRCLLTGYMRERPWQFDCRALPGWDARFAYFSVLEPLLIDALKTRQVVSWHAAAVERDGRAVVLPAVSGSGKSTTTLTLLALGYRFIADDVAMLARRGSRILVDGTEKGLYVTARSLQLVPEWRGARSGERRLKGRRWKYYVNLTRVRSRRRPVKVAALIFPRVSHERRTRIEPMAHAEALLECLHQAPKEFPASVLGGPAFEPQFELYSTLVQSARSYRVHLGSDQHELRRSLDALLVR